MPTLNWIGKEAVVDHHRHVPTRLLECDPELSVGDPDAENLLVEGDNLEALEGAAAALSRAGEVHLHRPALQHGQRRLGLQRQRQRSANPQMAGRNGRQGSRRPLPPR